MYFISFADPGDEADRSIVRCSGTKQILAIFRQPRPNDVQSGGLDFSLVTFFSSRKRK